MRIRRNFPHCVLTFAILTAAALASSIYAQTLPAKWSPTGSSKFTTNGFTLHHGTYTRLHNGSVIATGGPYINYPEEILRSVEIYDPNIGKWRDAEPMHYPRQGHSAVLLADGRLLVVGGSKASSPAPRIYAGPPEIYDPATGHWTVLNTSGEDISSWYQLPPLPVHVLLPNGKIAVIWRFGGVTINYLDPNTGVISRGISVFLQNVPGSGNDAATVLYDGTILLLMYRNTFVFNPETGTLIELSLPKSDGVDLSPSFSALLPNGNPFVSLSTFPSDQQPDPIFFKGIFDVSTHSWRNISQGMVGGSASVLLTDGINILTSGGLQASLYNTKTGEGKLTDDPKGEVFSPTLLADGRVLAGERVYGVPFDIVPGIANTSAASYRVESLARGSIASVFGAGFGDYPIFVTYPGPMGDPPLPNITTKVSKVFARTPNQINYLIPDDIPEGQAEMTIGNQSGLLSFTNVSPGIFTANANGRGVPAASILRVRANGAQSYEPVAQFDANTGRFVPRDIDLGPEGEQVYLVLFGTGWRHRSSQENTLVYVGGVKAGVRYVGAQGDFDGLDQMNVLLPRNAPRGAVSVLVTVDGKTANSVDLSTK